jgi:hypothetical protein
MKEAEQDPVARFWAAFHRYEHGRCWSAEGNEDEERGEALLEWEVRGPARYEAERERALRLGGSRLAAKSRPPYGDAGLFGRAAYALQLLACLYTVAEQVEEAARDRGWEIALGVLAYREPGAVEETEEDLTEGELVTELDPEELAGCDTLVLWIEVELPEHTEAAWRLGDGLGRLMTGAAGWLERLDAGDREAFRSVPRLPA